MSARAFFAVLSAVLMVAAGPHAVLAAFLVAVGACAFGIFAVAHALAVTGLRLRPYPCHRRMP